MAELLIVVDSTAKAAFMKEYYGDRAACVVCEWPLFKTSHQLAPGTRSGLRFQFDGLPAGQECLDALHTFRDKEILLALDETPRANYLCWQISGYISQIGGKPATVKRLTAKAFSKEDVDTSLRLAWPVNERQGLPFYGRLLFDDCLAHHLTRLVGTDRGPANLPLRHSSLTTLFLLAEREQERLMFPQQPYWQVQAELGTKGVVFKAHLSEGLDLPADGLIHSEAKARSLRDYFWETPFVVDGVNRTPLTITPPEPYQLAELLHDAIAQQGLDLAAAMAIVTKLFHGVSVHGKPVGLTTSFTPQAESIAPETVAALRRQVATLYGESTLADCAAPQIGMILPIHPELSGADLAKTLSKDENALYDLIRVRALSSQMRPAVGETITVDLMAGKEHLFQAHFHELKAPGFLLNVPAEMTRLQASCPGATFQEGQAFKPTKIECEPITNEGQTAERYTIETLLADLADFSVTADPVTITMIDDLIKAGYATMSKQGALQEAENTSKVVAILDRAFPKMSRINLAAYIEQTITEAATARKDLPFALKQFNQTLMLHGKALIKAKITAKVQTRARTSSTIIKQEVPLETARPLLPIEQLESTPAPPLPPAEAAPPPATPTAAPVPPQTPQREETPPSMDTAVPEPSAVATLPSAMAEEEWLHDAAPEPKVVAPTDEQTTPWSDDLKKIFAEALAGATPTAEEAKEVAPPPTAAMGHEASAPPDDQKRHCPVCKKPMLLKEDSFGAFWSCSGFPGCRYSESLSQDAAEGLACPLCDQKLNRRQTPTGKSFYVCENSDCQFMSWSRPHYLPCGLCDSPYLIEKTIRGITQLRCPRAGCPYGQPLAEEAEESVKTPAQATSPVTATNAAPKTKKVLVRRVAGGASTGGGTRKVRIIRRKA